ncbi:S1 RNA-binding domain-containing protein [Pendulispora albinea]|uniref:S1 RNA-binding domain-containing protein n=1 Tax=Pendulispora albinea TaxID=2741071 RepID=A0ABZ2LV89_9BACT
MNPIDSSDPSSTGKPPTDISSAPKVNASTHSLESSSASPNDAPTSHLPASGEAQVASPGPTEGRGESNAHEEASTPAAGESTSPDTGTGGEAAASGEAGAATGGPEKKKRRRRRRKKSGAGAQATAGTPGAEAQEEGEEGEGAEASESEASASVPGNAEGGASADAEGKGAKASKDKKKKPKKDQRPAKEARERPAFNVGDVVFGKILDVGEDAIFVDLSGKGRAIFDKLELLLPEDVADQLEEESRRAEARAEAIISGRDPDAAEAAAAASHAKEAEERAKSLATVGEATPAATDAGSEASQASPASQAGELTNGSLEAGDLGTDAEGLPHRRIVQARPKDEETAGAETLANGQAEAPVAAAEASDVASGGEAEAAPVESAESAGSGEGTPEAQAEGVEAAAAEPLAAGVVQLPRVVLEPGAPFVGVVHNDGGRGGLVVLTHHPKRASKAKPTVAAAYKQKNEIFGLVTGVIKGGVEVDVDGVRAFAPGSHMDLRLGADLHPLVGRRLPFFVTQYGKRGRDVVLSRRALLEAEAKVTREAALAKITPGSVVPGVVRSVVQFGAFIDIGGVEGLVPLTEMSHNRGDTPSDVFKVGATVDVKILRVDEKGKVWLSRRATIPDPWLAVAEKYAFGTRHTGKIVRLQPFGAFVELEPGVDGLIHTADLSIKRIEHPSDVVNVGDPIEVVVASLDPGSHRIGLHPAPSGPAADEAPQRVQLHKVVKVQVVSIETGGLTVRVLGATGRHARGFIPAGGTGTPRGTDLRKAFPPGHTLDAKVIEMDPKRSEIKLSIRAMQEETERSAYQQYRQQVKREAKFGTFADLLAKRGPTQK